MKDIETLIREAGGTIEDIAALPDGSGFATAAFPLPKNHWLTAPGQNEPPMPFQMGTSDERRVEVAKGIEEAARYSIRAATMNGKEPDFDPDAMVQCFVVGMLGYWTPDGTDKTSDLSERE